jgi:hypothetical protein
MAGGLPLFGLTVNPFADHVLDPLARPEDADLFTVVDGLERVAEIDAFLTGRAHAGDGPTFVLVKGPDGSGRTSVANLVLSSWKVALPEARNLVLPRAELGETRSARQALAEWLACLRHEARRLGLPLPDDLDRRLKEFFALGADSISFATDLRYLLSELSSSAVGHRHFLVALFDGLDIVDLVPAAVSAFADTTALVVFVAGDYPSQLDPLLGEAGRAALPAGRSYLIELGHLREDQVAEVARSRWEHAVKFANFDVVSPPLPFDPVALGPALVDGGPRTVRRVLRILSELVELRESQFAGRRQVTDEQLRFDADDLEVQVRILDALSAD